MVDSDITYPQTTVHFVASITVPFILFLASCEDPGRSEALTVRSFLLFVKKKRKEVWNQIILV